MAPNTSTQRHCQRCHKGGGVAECCQCRLVDYCSRGCQREDWKAHKILCSRVPKAIKKADAKIASFRLSDYTARNVGTFMVTEAVARRGEVVEEREAQEKCYDAMEMPKGSPDKLRVVLDALELFPLCTEAWGMLGHFYQYEITKFQGRKVKCAELALEMYDYAILSARKLNPTWTEGRADELPWGEIDNRPYLRSLCGRAIAFKDSGKIEEAISQAKKLMRLNPNDNQGVRKLLCTWYLEAGDTERCTNLMRKFGTNMSTSLAYTDVLLQFMLWMKDDAVENDVKQALYVAIKENPFVPGLIGADVRDNIADANDFSDEEDDGCYSPGDIREARMYVTESNEIWNKHPEVLNWVKLQKYPDGIKKPTEDELVDLLKSGTKFQVTCIHTDLDGGDRKKSTLIGTQKRGRCIGCALKSFHWPRRLNRPHQIGADILIHHNDFEVDKNWRKTKYEDVIEVPYWQLHLRFNEDDPDDYDALPESMSSSTRQPRVESAELPTSLRCKTCNLSNARFCALDNDCTAFYCSETCMKDYLEESEPVYIDLQSQTLKLCVSSECSIKTIRMDDALRVAIKHMPSLNSMDVRIDQNYVIREDWGCGATEERDKKLILTPEVLKEFFEKKRNQLVSVSFCLDDCCWEEFKEMTDRCRSLLPLGTMPNLRKLDLSNFGFDDIQMLTSCLSEGLQALRLDYVMLGPALEWSHSDLKNFGVALSRLTSLVSLSLANTKFTARHLQELLPKLKFVKCLDLSGQFGNAFNAHQGHCQLTDAALHAIGDNLPNLLSLTVDYQSKITIHGIRGLIKKCPNLVELELAGIPLSGQHITEILTTANNLLFLLVDVDVHEHAIQNAIKAPRSGVLAVNLPPAHLKNQKESQAKIEKAHMQRLDLMKINKWVGIL